MKSTTQQILDDIAYRASHQISPEMQKLLQQPAYMHVTYFIPATCKWIQEYVTVDVAEALTHDESIMHLNVIDVSILPNIEV